MIPPDIIRLESLPMQARGNKTSSFQKKTPNQKTPKPQNQKNTKNHQPTLSTLF